MVKPCHTEIGCATWFVVCFYALQMACSSADSDNDDPSDSGFITSDAQDVGSARIDAPTSSDAPDTILQISRFHGF